MAEGQTELKGKDGAREFQEVTVVSSAEERGWAAAREANLFCEGSDSKYFRFFSSDGFGCRYSPLLWRDEGSCEQHVVNGLCSQRNGFTKQERGRIWPVVCSLLTLGYLFPNDWSYDCGSSTKMVLRWTKGAFRAGTRICIFPKPKLKGMAFHVVYLLWKLLFLQSIYHDNCYIPSIKADSQFISLNWSVRQSKQRALAKTSLWRKV